MALKHQLVGVKRWLVLVNEEACDLWPISCCSATGHVQSNSDQLARTSLERPLYVSCASIITVWEAVQAELRLTPYVHVQLALGPGLCLPQTAQLLPVGDYRLGHHLVISSEPQKALPGEYDPKVQLVLHRELVQQKGLRVSDV